MVISNSILNTLSLFRINNTVINEAKYNQTKSLIDIVSAALNTDELLEIIDIDVDLVSTGSEKNPYDIRVDIYFGDVVFLDPSKARKDFFDALPRLKALSFKYHSGDEESCVGILSFVVDGYWDLIIRN